MVKKQVWPGHMLPVSHLSNSGSLDVEGALPETGKRYPPVPVFIDAAGRVVIRFHARWRERLRGFVGISSLSGMKPHAECLLSWVSWWKFVFTGNMWQFGQMRDGRFVGLNFSASFPLDEPLEKQVTNIGVIMAGNDMVPVGGVGEIATLRIDGGKFVVVQAVDLGQFDSEREALDAYSEALRRENRKQWNNCKDALSYAGDASEKIIPDMVCPACGNRLIKQGPIDDWLCFHCRDYYHLTTSGEWPEVKKEIVLRNAEFVADLVAKGFTAEQARSIWNLVRESIH